jgi:CheY-like chemotaxis protein
MIKSICMIDDEEIDIYQVNRLLKKTKNVEHFYSFSDGKEALEHYENFEESQNKFEGHFPPSIVLLDINMPRMGGFEFLEEIQNLPEEKKCKSVIIMLTSSSQERDKELAANFPIVKGFLVKPLTNDKLEDIFKLIEE